MTVAIGECIKIEDVFTPQLTVQIAGKVVVCLLHEDALVSAAGLAVTPLMGGARVIEVSSGVAPAEPVHIGGEALLIQFGRHRIVSTAVKWLLSKLKTRGLRLNFYLHII